MTAAPSIDAVLTGPAAIVPGLHGLLGLPRRQAIRAAGETLEDLCARISRGAPARFRVRVAADGRVVEVTQ